jgi:signal transduction histidine kinase
VHCTSITLHVVDSDPIVIRLDQPLTDSPGMPADDTSASIDEWAAAFAHGINNPLAVIDSEVGLILDVLSSGDDPSATVSGTELAETGREIRHQIRRCTRATAALQSVFRRRAPRFQPTSLYALLERFEREWPDRANLAGVTISVSLSDPLMNIKTDPWLLEQALMTAVGLVLEVCEECVPVDMMIGQGLSPDGLLILVRAGAVQDASQRKSAEMKMLRLKLDNSGKAVVEAMNAFVNRLGGSWSIEGKQGQWAEVRFTLCEPAGLDDPSAVED